MSSKVALTKKCVGLWTASNRYDVPDGALVQATNVLIRRDGVIQPRWGASSSSSSMAVSGTTKWVKAIEYKSTLFFAGPRDDYASYTIGSGSPGTAFSGMTAQVTGEDPPSLTSNFVSPTSLPFYDLEFLKTGGNLYYNCFRGLIRIGDTTGTAIRRAGGYPCAIAITPRPISTALARTSPSTTVTATTAFAHGYAAGMTVVMTSAGNAKYTAGAYTIVTVPSSTTFTYVDATDNTTSTLAAQTFAAAQFVGSNGILTTNEQVAFRAVLTEYDVNGTEYIGEVSTRAVVTNASPAIGAGANKNIQLAVLFGINGPAANSKIQLYRTKKGTVSPGGEFFKVYEKFLTTDEISRGYIWLTDITPDTLTGEALYTNESQEGELRNNRRPACAKTAALWQDKVVMANTTDFPAVEMQLLSTDSAAGGLAAGDAFRLHGSDADTTSSHYFACASGTAFSAGNQFVIYTGGTASTDVRNTVLSLIDTINWGTYLTTPAPLSTFLASFTSVGDDWPGRFAVARVTPDQYDLTHNTPKTRTVVASGAYQRTRGAFAPKLGIIYSTSVLCNPSRFSNVVTISDAGLATTTQFEVGEYVVLYSGASGYSTQTQASIGGTVVEGRITAVGVGSITVANTGSNGNAGAGVYQIALKYMPTFNQNTQVNRVKVSKRRYLESFPAFSEISVGQPGQKVLKCVPCGESLLVFKEDGLFRVVEDAEGVLRAEMLDPTAFLWAKDSAVSINGKVMAWLRKGVAIIGEGGVEKYVSERVFDKFQAQTLESQPATRRAQAVVDEINGIYELRKPATDALLPLAENVVYCMFNDTWVQDTIAPYCETIYGGLRYFQNSDGLLWKQLETDYYEGATLTTTTVTSFAVTSQTNIYTVNNNTGPLYSVGTYVVGDNGSQFLVSAVNGSTYTIYSLSGLSSLSTAVSWTAYTPVTCTIEWAPITLTEENRLKLFKEAHVLFGLAEHPLTLVSTSTELVPTAEQLAAYATSYGGLTPGGAASGINAYSPASLRVIVPQQHRRAQQLHLKVVIYTAFVASGLGQWSIVGVGCVANAQAPRISR